MEEAQDDVFQLLWHESSHTPGEKSPLVHVLALHGRWQVRGL